jgi:hypothetical protein
VQSPPSQLKDAQLKSIGVPLSQMPSPTHVATGCPLLASTKLEQSLPSQSVHGSSAALSVVVVVTPPGASVVVVASTIASVGGGAMMTRVVVVVVVVVVGVPAVVVADAS